MRVHQHTDFGQGEIDCTGMREKCDEAGLKGILLYAGGIITDWEGKALDTKSPARVLAAANPALHAAAREILSGA